jgi:sugar porter (SP) family MFS transporter
MQGLWYVALLAAFASLNSCNLGFDLGVTAGAILGMQADLGLTDDQVELFVGIVDLSGTVGAACSFLISDHLGRRRAFTVCAAIYICGIFVQINASGFIVLLLGRMVVGLSVGLALSLDPMYIAEVAPAEYRGTFVTWSELALNIGIVLGLGADYLFANLSPSTSWRVMLSCGLPAPILLIIVSVAALPESPRWLVSKGRTQEAKEVLAKLCLEGDNVEQMVDEMEETIRREKDVAGCSALCCPTPTMRRMLTISLGLAIAMHMTTQGTLLFYGPRVLMQAGMHSSVDAVGFLVAVAIVKTLMIGVASAIVDVQGRRVLLLYSSAGIVASLGLLAFSLSTTPPIIGLSYTAFFAFFVFFSLGLGPVTWLIPAEIFPVRVRARAMSIGTVLNRLSSGAVTSTFLSLTSAMTFQGYYAFFAVVNLGTLGFIWYTVPETNGRTLEEMDELFSSDELPGDVARRRLFGRRELPETERLLPEGAKPLKASQSTPVTKRTWFAGYGTVAP